MAKSGVKSEPEVTVQVEEEPQEVYTGNVYEFYGGITVSGNSGPVTITVNLQGVPNNPPPSGGGNGNGG